MIASNHLKTKNINAGHITTNASPRLAQVNNAPVLNKSAAIEEEEPTTEITGEAENSIKNAKINNLPNSVFKES